MLNQLADSHHCVFVYYIILCSGFLGALDWILTNEVMTFNYRLDCIAHDIVLLHIGNHSNSMPKVVQLRAAWGKVGAQVGINQYSNV